jgi:cyclopropane fatty-acyl-phospholipid synthase-like methyltransferase
MACALSESTFLGVDLSARQIKPGQEVVAALGLTNIELRHSDIRDVDQSFGVFDYVIAHGIYSWVPTEVQEKIFRICREQLRASGVAYLSYNTYPGWRMRGMLRDMMVYHGRKFDDLKKQIENAAHSFSGLASRQIENNPYGMLLERIEHEAMAGYLFPARFAGRDQ